MLRFQTRGFGRRAQFERLATKDFAGFVLASWQQDLELIALTSS